MNKFADLLMKDVGLPAQEQQNNANARFPLLVTNSNLKLWQPGDTIPCCKRRLLIGVAAGYSVPDLQLLDTLSEKLLSADGTEDHIDVFNVSDCQSMTDFEKYIPGVGNVYQTPVVGLWEGGVLVDKAWGASARSLIERMYQLPV